MDYKIIKLHEVVGTTGVARSTLYKMIAAGTFPEPIQLGQRSVGWVESEVQSWIKSRIDHSRGSQLSSTARTDPNHVSFSEEECDLDRLKALKTIHCSEC